MKVQSDKPGRRRRIPRVRRSTVALAICFIAIFALWITVRPNPADSRVRTTAQIAREHPPRHRTVRTRPEPRPAEPTPTPAAKVPPPAVPTTPPVGPPPAIPSPAAAHRHSTPRPTATPNLNAPAG